MGTLLPVGTKKGLFLLRGGDGNESWRVEGPVLPGWSVYHAIVDPRDGALYAATNNFFYGATVHRSDDLGETWERAEELGLAGVPRDRRSARRRPLRSDEQLHLRRDSASLERPWP